MWHTIVVWYGACAQALYPNGLVSVLLYPIVCFPQHKKLEIFRSLVQYRLSCDLANSNVDCQLELIRTVDCFLFFFVFFSFLFGDSNSNLSNVTHDFVGTRALADVSEFLFFFSFQVKVNFTLCWFECTRNGSSFRNLSAFLRFERSSVRNSIEKLRNTCELFSFVRRLKPNTDLHKRTLILKQFSPNVLIYFI